MQTLRSYYQIISCFFFSILGFQIKIELANSSIENIVFYRSIWGFLILLIILLISKKLFVFKNYNLDNIKIHFLRATFGVLAMYFGYGSLNYLSLSQASTVAYTKVFFTTILALIVFREKIKPLSIALIFIGIAPWSSAAFIRLALKNK